MNPEQPRGRSFSLCLAAAAAAALCALAGCSSGTAKPAALDSSPLIPWSSAVPAELRAPQTGAPSACRASNLRVTAGLDFQATVVGASGSVQLRNAGRNACRLTGRPLVRFVGAPRAPAQQDVPEPAQPPEFPSVSKPAASLLALAPGATATLSLDWRNWCVPGPRSSAPVVPPSAARVTLPQGRGSIDVPYNAVTSCTEPGAPSTIGVQPFQAQVLPSSRPWSTVLLAAKILTIKGAPAPLFAYRGSVLRYSIVLYNVSRETLTFDRCPLFAEELAPNGGVQAGMLNCAHAHPVRPGRSIRFEMRIVVPSGAPAGINGLFWDLDPLGSQGPEATARVIVARR